MEWLDKILQSPAFTVIVSVIFVCIFTLIIFKNTSYGKKSISLIKMSFSRLESVVGSFQVNTEKKINQALEGLKEYEEKIDTKIAEFDKTNKETRELIILVADNINNKKIKEYLQTFLEKTDFDLTALKEEYKQELIDKVEEIKGVVEDVKE